jgi:tRNA (adenine57-N1/adenine58-N1)-methyltransferase
VLFYFNSSKKWLAKISKKDELHTHIGVLKHADAIGKEYGSKLITNKDKYVYLLKPTMYDYVMKIQHGTQIVYPKDLGYIVARAGIQNGQKIVEIGTGSASLTSFVASIVKPRGHVYTFDVDENFMKIAAKNLKKSKMEKYVTMENLDIKTVKKVPMDDADVALIDLGDPWTVIPQVRQMLKGSGAVFAICPTMNQLEKLTMALIENEFTDIESTEHILRTIDAREGKTRHSFQGIGHTTYLCFARKAFFDRGSKSKTSKSKTVEKKTLKKTTKKAPSKKKQAKTSKSK